MEVVFGSETILSKEHLALAQASQTVAAYGFADALIDHKALVEALSRLLGRAGTRLLDRVVEGSLRFRLLRGRPSHEKLYLLSGPAGARVLTGSANLGRAAFEGWQHEILVVFDGEPAWRLFDSYYQRDWKDSVPVAIDALIAADNDGAPMAREEPLMLEDVPIVRALSAGVALVDQPARPAPTGFTADALRQASALGAELKDLVLPKDKAGRTVINAGAMLRVIRSHRARPVADAGEDGIPRAEIDFATGLVRLDGIRWLAMEDEIPAEAIAKDAGNPRSISRQLPVVLWQRRGGDRGLLGLSGMALCGAGGTLFAASGRACRHRPLGLPGLCRVVWPIERRQDAVHQDRHALDVRL